MRGAGFGIREGMVSNDLPTVTCNLCLVEGKEFRLPHTDDVIGIMDRHTKLDHPEHEAALRRGETYVPVDLKEAMR